MTIQVFIIWAFRHHPTHSPTLLPSASRFKSAAFLPRRGYMCVTVCKLAQLTDEWSTREPTTPIGVAVFLFFLFDQKETKNQGHKNPSRSVWPIKERYPRFKNRTYLTPDLLFFCAVFRIVSPQAFVNCFRLSRYSASFVAFPPALASLLRYTCDVRCATLNVRRAMKTAPEER